MGADELAAAADVYAGAIYKTAGMRLTRTVPADSYWSVVEGVAD